MPNENAAYFWKKKDFLSYLLSIFVFLIHISSFEQHNYSATVLSGINDTVAYFFTEAITRFAVPMFFLLAGVAFFRNYTAASYVSKLKSRFFTLVIPYLIWNTLWMIFETICSYSFLSRYFTGREKFELTFINILKGIFLYECNGPFWSIFTLIALTVVAPFIDFLTSKKSLAFLSVGALIVLRVCGIEIPVFAHTNAIVYYMIGAIIGKYYLDGFMGKASKKTQVLSALFLCVYVILKTVFRPGPFGPLTHLVQIVIFTLSSFCLWNAADIFMDKIGDAPAFSRSFAVYAMHINVSAIITKLIALAANKQEIWAIPNFLITTIFTLIIIDLFCTVTSRYCPKLYAVLMGRRGR